MNLKQDHGIGDFWIYLAETVTQKATIRSNLVDDANMW